jgi:hypothetical protein
MSGESERVGAFVRWAEGHADGASAAERSRIAAELFVRAGHGPVRDEHIDALLAEYRERVAGARAILAARAVGDALLEWQRARAGGSARPSALPSKGPAGHLSIHARPSRPSPSRASSASGPRPSENGEAAGSDPFALGLEPRDERQARASGIARQHRVALELEAEQRSPSAPPRELEALEAREAREARVARGAQRGDARASVPDLELPPVLSRGALGAPRLPSDLGAPERGARGSTPPPPGESAVSSARASSPRPPAPEPRTSSSPPPRSSSRPAPSQEGDAFALAAPVVARASAPPPGPLRSTPPPPLASPRPALPAMAEPFVPPTQKPDAHALRLVAYAIGTFGLLIGLLVVLTRPAFLFGHSVEVVEGGHTSKHLGLSLTFATPFKHAVDLDDSETVGGWDRRSAVYFTGQEPLDFDSQLTVVTLSKKGTEAPTDEEVRAHAAREAMHSQGRRCLPTRIDQATATTCLATALRNGRSVPVLEVYFALGERVVFARAVANVTVAPASALQEGPIGPIRPGKGVTPMKNEAERAIEPLEAIIQSIRPL